MTTRIQLRRGTAAEWIAANPVLSLGEAGIETDTQQWKVGDGVTVWIDLPYMTGGGSGNAIPGGSNTQVQFNDNGAFGGHPAFTFNKATDLLVIPGNVIPSVDNSQNLGLQGYRWKAIVAGNISLTESLSANNATIGNITSSRNLYANTGTFYGDQFSDGAIFVGNPAGTVLGSDVVMQITANAGGYSQTNFQNINSGPTASGDYIITADNGNDITNYLDLGMTSSGWDGSETNVLSGLGPNNGYLYVQDGNLTVGTRAGSISYPWKFDTTGTLTLPNNTAIKDNSDYAIAIGVNAGLGGSAAVSLGSYAAGNGDQGFNAIAIGGSAGQYTQAPQAVAIGGLAGNYNQGAAAIAIGSAAGQSGQGANAIAIGAGAGDLDQPSNSIIINANGSELNGTNAGLYIDPVRNDTGNTTNAVYYNTITKELTYGPGGSGNGSPGGNNTQVQYNNNGSFAGHPNFTFDADTDTLTVPDSLVVNNVYSASNTVVHVHDDLETFGDMTAVGYYLTDGGSWISIDANTTAFTAHANLQLVTGSGNTWTFDNTGTLTTAGNILPPTSNVYSLGSETQQWKDLYVSNATIYMNSVPIGLTSGNTLTVGNEPVLANNSDTSIVTTGNISATALTGASAALGNLVLEASTISQASGAAETNINISPTVEGWAYLQIPNNDNANVDNVRLHNDAGNIEIATGNFSTGSTSYTWAFDNTGNVQLPGGAILGNPYGDAPNVAGLQGGMGGYAIINSTDQRQFVQTDNTAVYIGTDYPGNTNVWTFGTDGNLALPGNTFAVNYANGQPVSLDGTYGNSNVTSLLESGSVITDINTQGNIVSGGDMHPYGNLIVSGNVEFYGLQTTVYHNLSVSENVSVTGNITGGNLITAGTVYSSFVTSESGALTLQAASGHDLVLDPVAANISAASNWINNLADPQNPQDAATKKYVDDNSAGLNIHDPVLLATTQDLATYTGATVTYNNGTDGVGATLSFSGNTLTTLDGTSITGGSSTRLLIKNEANAVYNGVYTYTSSSQLTRSTDMDQPAELGGGDYVFVQSGATQASSSWVQQGAVGNVGISNVNFVQFSASQSYSAGNALTLGGSQFNVNVDNSTVIVDGSNQLKIGTVPAANVSGLATVATSGLYSDLTGAYGNANVEAYLSSYSGNISTTGNISGAYLFGDGSQLTGLPASYGNSNVVLLLSAFGSNTVSTTGNVTSGNVTTSKINATDIYATTITLSGTGTAVNASGGNILTNQVTGTQFNFLNGLYTATLTGGGATSNYTLSLPANAGSNGQFLTTNGSGALSWATPAAGYSDSNVTTLLAAFGANTISSTGNITTSANISGGNLKTTGLISATGTITGSSLLGTVVSVSANITGGNLLTGGLISATGNITSAGNISGGNIIGTFVAPGANTQVMFNDAGVIGGNASLTFTKTTGNLNVTGNVVTSGDVWATSGNFRTGATTANIVNATPTTVNIAGGASLATNIGNASGTINLAGNVQGSTNGFAIGYRDIPQVSFTGNATLTLSDAGKHYYSTQSSNFILTVPNNSSVGFSVGSAINIVNQGTGTMTIAQGSGVTMYFAGNSTSGNRTLSSYGMATLQKVATDTWFVVGVGVT